MAEHEAAGDPETEHWPAVVGLARLSVYFLAQGGLALLAYAYYGFGSNPEHFPLGFRIDPILAAINLVWGLIGTYIGFFNPRYAIAFVLASSRHAAQRAGESVPLGDRATGLGDRALCAAAQAGLMLSAGQGPPVPAACPWA